MLDVQTEKPLELKIALFTPGQNPYSETFVQAHKKQLQDKVYYYFGTGTSTRIEGEPAIFTKGSMWSQKLANTISGSKLSFKDALLKKSLLKNKIDVVLVEYGLHAHKVLSAIRSSNLPMVVHFHGYDASAYEAYEKTNNYKEVFDYASKIVAVSTVMVEMLKEKGCPEDKLVLNPCGPAGVFSEVVPKFSEKQFLAMGRFTDKKAPYYSILAFSEVLKEHPDARLLFAGEGALLNTCRNLTRYLNIENAVKFVGVISQQEFMDYLSGSLAFVQHSVRAENGDMEGTPVTVQEASLAGIPVISTRHAGITDVVVHGKTGLLCDEHDVDGMAKNMLELLDSTEKAREMGMAGRKHISENHSLEKHIAVLQKTLENSVSS